MQKPSPPSDGKAFASRPPFSEERFTGPRVQRKGAKPASFGADFPATQVGFDRFHVIKLMGDAVDQVRRSKASCPFVSRIADAEKVRPELKKSWFL